MNQISKILGKLIEDYYKTTRQKDRECRILMPGLEKGIAKGIQTYLLSREIPSLLVVDKSEEPIEEKGWIYPDGLTSKREGSLIIIVFPGEMAYIQDSIKGAGGTIRSIIFSDEWPWIDDGNDFFRFDGPFLERLLKIWTDVPDIQEWFHKFIIHGLLPATVNSHNRADLLLNKLIGSFSSSLYPNLLDIKEKFARHYGVPCDENDLRKDSTSFIKSARDICEKVLEANTKLNIREDIKQRIEEVAEEESEQAELEKSLDIFFDGLGTSEYPLSGILGLYNCWGEKEEISVWKSLNSEILRRLFDIHEVRDFNLEGLILCDRALISPDGRSLVTFLGEKISVSARYSIPETAVGSCRVRLVHKREILEDREISSLEGTENMDINTEDFFTKYSKKPILLKIQLSLDNNVVKEWKFRLHVCGEDRTFIMLVTPVFSVFDATDDFDQDEETAEKLEVNTRVRIYLFNFYEETIPALYCEGKELSLDKQKDGILKCDEFIDPSDSPKGQAYVRAEFGKRVASVILEAKDLIRGEFTLEDELRVCLAQGKKERLKILKGIFEGIDKEPYTALGQIDERTRQRIYLGKIMELDEYGGVPIIVDLCSFGTLQQAHRDNTEFIRKLGDNLRFPPVKISPEVKSLIDKYHESRNKLLDYLSKCFNINRGRLDRPLYAALPIYIENSSEGIEKFIREYIDVYVNVLDYLQNKISQLSWGETFILTYLDCVINWDNSHYKNSFFLMGPWHPLVVAKRYMVQKSLYISTSRYLSNKTRYPFNRLAVLLEQVHGYRWFFSLHDEDTTLEEAYSAATSDPGWMLMVKVSSGGINVEDVERIMGFTSICLGLQSNLLPVSCDYMALGYMKNFVHAYPTRRSLIAYIKKGYSPRQILDSASELLYKEDDITFIGAQLPGGVHLFFEDSLEDIERIEWRKPPICIYANHEHNRVTRADHIDMTLFPPLRKIAFLRENKKFNLPRGKGNDSVFHCPLVRLTEGADGTPSSVVFESDIGSLREHMEESIGASFVACLSKIAGLFSNALTVNRSLGLPMPEDMKSPWTIFPGQQVDPAIFVRYIRDGYERWNQVRALWDYKVSLEGRMNTYYILSTIPPGYSNSLKGSKILNGEDISAEVIKELGEIGVAIGTESMRSGKKALGVLGMVAAIRLLKGMPDQDVSPFLNDDSHIGILLPVDPFGSFLEGLDTKKRADLLAIQLGLSEEAKLNISFCSVECKYVSGKFGEADVKRALQQANETYNSVAGLVLRGNDSEGILERLALLNLIAFGLRLNAEGTDEWMEKEQKVLSALIQGNIRLVESQVRSLLVTSECGMDKAELRKRDGWWIRLAPGHWPGVSDSEELDKIRKELTKIFSRITGFSKEEKGEIFIEDLEGKEQGIVRVVEQVPQPAERETQQAARKFPLILLGCSFRQESIFYNPTDKDLPLDNLNIMITGSSGKGKTALVKSLVWGLREQSKNVLVLDFKNDFANDRPFISRSLLDCQYVTFDGLPYNPLMPIPLMHPRTKKPVIHTARHITEVASVLKEAYRLGVQQEYAVKKAIRECFEDYGLSSSDISKYDENQEFPDFNDVGRKLAESNPPARQRLDPLFDLGIFRDEYKNIGFEQMITRSLIVQLSDIGSNDVKNALAQIIVLSAHNYYNSKEQTSEIRQYFVFDEAHRVLKSSFLLQFVRECRAYGVGVILSSQYPTDFPLNVSGSMASKIIHGSGRDDAQVKSVVNILGWQGEEIAIADMGMFEAVVSNNQYSSVMIYTLAYPQALIYSYLQKNKSATHTQLSEIEGLDQNRLLYLLNFMMKAGLLEEVNEKFSLINGSD